MKDNKVTELFLYGSILVILTVILIISMFTGEKKDTEPKELTSEEKVKEEIEEYIEENELELVNPKQEITGDFFQNEVKGDAWEEGGTDVCTE